jgi:hypothetical protein
MTGLIIIDMQNGSFSANRPVHNMDGVIFRINKLELRFPAIFQKGFCNVILAPIIPPEVFKTQSTI